MQKRRRSQSDPPPDKKPAVTAAGIGAIKPEKPRIPQSVLAPKSLRQRLLKASADVHDLRIAAAMSRHAESLSLILLSRDEESSPSPRLDFRDSFTKAVVRWSGRHYAVDWSDAVEANHLSVGLQRSAGWEELRVGRTRGHRGGPSMKASSSNCYLLKRRASMGTWRTR